MPVLAAAAIVFALSTAGLALLVEPVPTWYYHLAWWSYIVAADDVNRRRSGRSLLRDRPAHFAWLAGVSVLWWTLFELANLRLGNWYYVMSLPWTPLRWAAGVVAFASVLPGIVETLALVENLGLLRSVRVRPLAWSAGKERAVLVLGAACLVLPLVWPDVFFPLTWGSLVFLLEPWNRRHARRSFLRDLEEGEAGPLCRTLLAGLVCGALWEAWNFWARTKWIYTVPGFEGLKVFEMPLAGFLGFPPSRSSPWCSCGGWGRGAIACPPARVRAARMAALALGPAGRARDVRGRRSRRRRLRLRARRPPRCGARRRPRAAARGRDREPGAAAAGDGARLRPRRLGGAHGASAGGAGGGPRARRAGGPSRPRAGARARSRRARHPHPPRPRAVVRGRAGRGPCRAPAADPRNRFLARRARVWTSGLGDATTDGAR